MSEFLAKIAVTNEDRPSRSGYDQTHNPPQVRQIAAGDGWNVSNVICTAGPRDQPFEEQHSNPSIAIVVGGTFQYRCPAGRGLMMPGAFLLGNAGESFTCGHEHGAGDRCVSFSYNPHFFDGLSREAGGRTRFKVPRLPPIRPLAPLAATAATLLAGGDQIAWEQLAIQVAAQAVQVEAGIDLPPSDAEPSSLARVTRVVRMIEHEPDMCADLSGLARIARLSPYHFLRTFERLTGTTPHQYVVRMRLRRASIRLRLETTRISDLALDCGFGDISNFNRAFRAEFGISPRKYRYTTP
jgi:AraC family transcriptional regulator